MKNSTTENIRTTICISGEKYAFDLEKIKDFCLMSDKEKAKEQELIENFENNDSTGELEMISKISREVKSSGNPQNDSIIYDMVKIFISVLLNDQMKCTDKFENMNFSTALSFNTLIESGILYKIG